MYWCPLCKDQHVVLVSGMNPKDMIYKVGDRIRVIRDGGPREEMTTHQAPIDATGTIICVRGYKLPYAVEFDKMFEAGHTCDGIVKDGYGQWLSDEYIELELNTSPKINEGDMIALIDDSYIDWGLPKGSIGKVVHWPKGDNYHVDFASYNPQMKLGHNCCGCIKRGGLYINEFQAVKHTGEEKVEIDWSISDKDIEEANKAE